MLLSKPRSELLRKLKKLSTRKVRIGGTIKETTRVCQKGKVTKETQRGRGHMWGKRQGCLPPKGREPHHLLFNVLGIPVALFVERRPMIIEVVPKGEFLVTILVRRVPE